MWWKDPRTRRRQKGSQGMETASGNMTDFCLVVLANDEAVGHASETVRSRFAFLAEETRMTLVSAVAERVGKLAQHGTGGAVWGGVSLQRGGGPRARSGGGGRGGGGAPPLRSSP